MGIQKETDKKISRPKLSPEEVTLLFGLFDGLQSFTDSKVSCIFQSLSLLLACYVKNNPDSTDSIINDYLEVIHVISVISISWPIIETELFEYNNMFKKLQKS